MAKSLFDIAAEGKAEVSHNGDNVVVNLPEWWTEMATACLSDEGPNVEEWWDGIDVPTKVAVAQAAAAKTLIELRAAARPADFPASEGGGKRELNSPDKGGLLPQDRVAAYELKPLKRPGTVNKGRITKAVAEASKKATNAVWAATCQTMADKGMDREFIQAILKSAGAPEETATRLLDDLGV